MNANDIKPKGIKITLDKERELKYDLNALAELEEKMGSMDKVFEILENPEAMSIKTMRMVIWAGLVHEDPNLTEKDVGSMLSMSALTDVTISVMAAFEKALPEPEENSKNA